MMWEVMAQGGEPYNWKTQDPWDMMQKGETSHIRRLKIIFLFLHYPVISSRLRLMFPPLVDEAILHIARL